MKKYKYTGTFIAQDTGNRYELEVSCNGFLQAFILLTADAIRSGRHYQLYKMEDENGSVKSVDDILKIGELIK